MSGSGVMCLAADLARLRGLEDERLGVLDVHLEGHLLEVQDEVGRVLHRARDRRELVQHALHPDGGDGRALDAREQHAPQRRCPPSCRSRARTAGREAAEGVGEALARPLEPLRLLEIPTLPQHSGLRAVRARPPGLLRVQLDDELLLDREVDVVARGHATAPSPSTPAASSSSHLGTPRPFTASTDCATCAFLAARARRTTSPSRTWKDGMLSFGRSPHVAVAHELPRLGARAAEAEPVDDVVQPPLELCEQVLAGDALLLGARLEGERGTGPPACRRAA